MNPNFPDGLLESVYKLFYVVPCPALDFLATQLRRDAAGTVTINV